MPKRHPGASDNDLEQLTSLFRMLADKTRLNLLFVLGRGEQNVTGLCEELDLPQPTVSHHLGLLRMTNIIASRREGKQIFYSLNGQVKTLDSGTLWISVENYSVQVGPT